MSSCRIKKWQQFGRETIVGGGGGVCEAEKPTDAKKAATDAQLAALLKVRAEQDALYCGGGSSASLGTGSVATAKTTNTSSGR